MMSSHSKGALNVKRFFAIIILPLVFSLNLCLAYAKTLIPGGESIGIVMPYDGVLITGDYAFFVENQEVNINQGRFKSGDIIKKADDLPITSNQDLLAYIQQILPTKSTILVEIERDGERIEQELQIFYDEQTDTFKTGLYVKDNLSGIGTITFYDPEAKTYAALGHPLSESESEALEVTKGETFDAFIVSIQASFNGNPGQKVARIEKTKHLGDVIMNNDYGIYGHYQNLYKDTIETMETCSQDEVQLGKAEIRTVLADHEVTSYEIEITALKKQAQQEIKGITFRVTDSRLLEKTNGVIQGMSGSPIIQNGKLVGAVTHVSVDDVDLGYGVYIEWMLEENKKMIS